MKISYSDQIPLDNFLVPREDGFYVFLVPKVLKMFAFYEDPSPYGGLHTSRYLIGQNILADRLEMHRRIVEGVFNENIDVYAVEKIYKDRNSRFSTVLGKARKTTSEDDLENVLRLASMHLAMNINFRLPPKQIDQ